MDAPSLDTVIVAKWPDELWIIFSLKTKQMKLSEFLSQPRFGRRVPIVTIPVNVVVEEIASSQQNKFNENGCAEELEQNEGEYLPSPGIGKLFKGLIWRCLKSSLFVHPSVTMIEPHPT